MLRHKLAQLLHHIPVVLPVQLIGVTPDIEEPGLLIGAGNEFLCQRHQLVVGMMAGGIPDEEVLRNVEAMGRMDGSGPLVSGQTQQLHHLLIIAAIGIGKHFQRTARERLQPALVLNQIVHGKRRADGIQEGVVQPVAPDFMGMVDRLHLLLVDFGHVQLLLPRVSFRPSRAEFKLKVHFRAYCRNSSASRRSCTTQSS